MHLEAFAYVSRALQSHRWTGREVVVEVGGRNINGSVRPLFVHARSYTAIDVEPGDGIDVVMSGARYEHPEPIDLAVCCEVLEHTVEVAAIIDNITRQLAPGGRLIITTAGPDRLSHSGIDGGLVRDGEHYQNLTVDDIVDAVDRKTFDVVVEYGRGQQDIYACITRRPLAVTKAIVDLQIGVPLDRDLLRLNGVDVSEFVRGFNLTYDAAQAARPLMTIHVQRGAAVKLLGMIDIELRER